VKKTFLLVAELVIICFLASISGCRPSGETTPEVLLKDVADKACSCLDRACAEDALLEFKDTYDAIKNRWSSDEKEKDRVVQLSKKITVCLVSNGVDKNKVLRYISRRAIK
jgi:hypothetical protein